MDTHTQSSVTFRTHKLFCDCTDPVKINSGCWPRVYTTPCTCCCLWINWFRAFHPGRSEIFLYKFQYTISYLLCFCRVLSSPTKTASNLWLHWIISICAALPSAVLCSRLFLAVFCTTMFVFCYAALTFKWLNTLSVHDHDQILPHPLNYFSWSRVWLQYNSFAHYFYQWP